MKRLESGDRTAAQKAAVAPDGTSQPAAWPAWDAGEIDEFAFSSIGMIVTAQVGSRRTTSTTALGRK